MDRISAVVIIVVIGIFVYIGYYLDTNHNYPVQTIYVVPVEYRPEITSSVTAECIAGLLFYKNKETKDIVQVHAGKRTVYCESEVSIKK